MNKTKLLVNTIMVLILVSFVSMIIISFMIDFAIQDTFSLSSQQEEDAKRLYHSTLTILDGKYPCHYTTWSNVKSGSNKLGLCIYIFGVPPEQQNILLSRLKQEAKKCSWPNFYIQFNELTLLNDKYKFNEDFATYIEPMKRPNEIDQSKAVDMDTDVGAR